MKNEQLEKLQTKIEHQTHQTRDQKPFRPTPRGPDPMTEIVYDHHSNTYIAIHLPKYVVQKHMENYRNLDNYQVKGVRMDFTQYLIWENQCDINPDKITEIAASQVPEINQPQG